MLVTWIVTAIVWVVKAIAGLFRGTKR